MPDAGAVFENRSFFYSKKALHYTIKHITRGMHEEATIGERGIRPGSV